MNTPDAINAAAGMSTMVLSKYLEDLDDADLLRRPGPGCNHLAWQLGHLISSEAALLNSVAPGAAAELPDGFAEQHGKDATNADDPAKFCSKAQYLELFEQARAATKAALEGLSAEVLDAPAPEHMRSFFPTVGHMFMLMAMHPMMHAGQFVPVRRELGKPVAI
ncbi:MAG: hypothetical protein CMJ58_25200 [Planctomycetaceae bacterium]|nr:hypothetical protein [Planctomycetaceae bacterium]